ncbi:MAG TPA: ATP-dependent Clp protease adaptor ClpS [Bacteroidales bacterium]|nr:ATP-dependent Clp protease adaptor ClpS [Bacteroidales bacterium]HQB19779.1 ATP-dependent Clp protease adaptor ClpS [Bacteroidales bacterium]
MTQDKPHSYSEEKEVTFLDDIYTLLLINDDFNTFDFVIDALIELCHHTYEQAYQCTFITHNYGKCDIMHGAYTKLEVVANAMLERGLTVKIIQ